VAKAASSGSAQAARRKEFTIGRMRSRLLVGSRMGG
jgi:hypothetical protein